MIIKPKVWGFICTNAHPQGCEANVRDQIDTTRALGVRADGPKRVLVIGASTGYGLAARIAAAFGFGAATLGVFLEKPARGARTGSAGWYNAAAFDKLARDAGLKSVSINGDAFSNEARDAAIGAITEDLGGPVDLVIYSLAAPMRRLPDSGETVRTALKPIGAPFRGRTIDTDHDRLADAQVEPATEDEIAQTTRVMGGDDWALWVDALAGAGVLAENAKTVAFSYLGPEITWAIYRYGAIGHAKQHLERTAEALHERHADRGLNARVAILKSIVTQASAAIPVIPLYISLVFRVMKDKGLHEGAIEQQNRLLRDALYPAGGEPAPLDAEGRLRLDDRELRDDVQQACTTLWPQVNDGNLFELTDYAGYKSDFLKLFGFARDDIDYDADVPVDVDFNCLKI
ncbi:MAG TPA: enoyl-ACP reductase FabV [Gammaproteobacteria bacterium]|nr:enoyl-ACP reductase FabV [Gammaproteobacteria bacterium]